MRRLLIFVDWFLPGFKAGGQISSCANIAYALRNEIQVYIITSDRDLDDALPYQGIVTNSWIDFDAGIRVNYRSPGQAGYNNIKQLIREINPDAIYFNSMFSFRYTLLPLVVIKAMGYQKKVVLAPRGMLQEGALQFRKTKKRVVLALLYHTALLNKIIFHATDETEATDIQKNIKGYPETKLVYDFPSMKQDVFTGIDKQPGYLKCLFISRIVEKKNLLYLLRLLATTTKNISLTIVGPVEDKQYWNVCKEVIGILPTNCTVNYKGAVSKNGLAAIYRCNHLFVLPTLGENFGHVIFDAFLNGRPALISDQTPWHQLRQKQAGMDISLSDQKQFAEALEDFADMDHAAFEIWCKNAWTLGADHIGKAGKLTTQYKLLFS